jgi:hypothetical protein
MEVLRRFLRIFKSYFHNSITNSLLTDMKHGKYGWHG